MPRRAHDKLTRSALAGPVVGVARDLLGVEVHTFVDGAHTAARVVETEAYRGADDRAAHSYGYKRTKRTEVFFGAAGYAYVYLVYGIHDMFNIVVGPPGEPNAALVRAVEPIVGVGIMQRRRGLPKPGPRVSNGPALVCQALGITRAHYNVDLLAANSPVQLRGALGTVAPGAITVSPRVGVAYAGTCAARPWRFRESGNVYTSPAK